MMGEELNASYVTERGLLGDRTRALVDQTTGNVASAKNPRKEGNSSIFGLRSLTLQHRVNPSLTFGFLSRTVGW
jgi:uncharacterized protein YcbX